MALIARRELRPISAHRHEVLELLERLLADELPSSQVVDRGECLLVPRRERILAAVTGPIPGSASSSADVARFRSSRAGSARCRARPPIGAGGCGRWLVVARGDAGSGSPSRSGAARLSSRLARFASTRGPWPPAAATRSPTREPAANRKTPVDRRLRRSRRPVPMQPDSRPGLRQRHLRMRPLSPERPRHRTRPPRRCSNRRQKEKGQQRQHDRGGPDEQHRPRHEGWRRRWVGGATGTLGGRAGTIGRILEDAPGSRSGPRIDLHGGWQGIAAGTTDVSPRRGTSDEARRRWRTLQTGP